MRKMLKFKEFSSLLEDFVFEGKTKPTGWVLKLKEAYQSLFGANEYFVDPGLGSNKVAPEIMRADFILGKIGESEDNLKKFLSSSVKLTEDQYELEEVGKGDSGSGSFPGFIIKFKESVDWFGKQLYADTEYTIINAKKIVDFGGEQSAALIGDKQTTPDKLGLTGEWPSRAIIQEVSKNEIRDRINNQDCKDFMCDLVDAVCKYQGNLDKAADTMKFTKEDFSVKIDLSKYIGKIDSESINNIQKDFGEVLGGIFMFSLVKGFQKGLEFPGESNTELVDFYFDGMSVSSKAGTKGAKSSSSGYKTAIDDHCKKTKYVLNPKEQTVKDILNIITSEDIEVKNTKYLVKARSSAIFMGSIQLFDKFLSSGHNRWIYFRQTCTDPIGQLNRDAIIDVFVKKRKTGNLHEFLQGFLNASKFKEPDKDSKGRDAALTKQLITARDEDKAQFVFDIIIKENRYDILVGLILYYCSVDLREVINKKYIKDLSELINKSIKVNQLYLKIKIKTNSITFTIKPMTSNEFEFGNLNGISTWSTKMIPISMK
jgi:hypothetical protein